MCGMDRGSRGDHDRPRCLQLCTWTTNGAERRRGDFGDWSCARTHAQPCAELESSRARGSYTTGWKFSPPTVLRTGAQAKYWKRFRAAYGPHCSRAETLPRPSNRRYPAAPSARRRHAKLRIAVTSVATSSSPLLPPFDIGLLTRRFYPPCPLPALLEISFTLAIDLPKRTLESNDHDLPVHSILHYGPTPPWHPDEGEPQ